MSAADPRPRIARAADSVVAAVGAGFHGSPPHVLEDVRDGKVQAHDLPGDQELHAKVVVAQPVHVQRDAHEIFNVAHRVQRVLRRVVRVFGHLPPYELLLRGGLDQPKRVGRVLGRIVGQNETREPRQHVSRRRGGRRRKLDNRTLFFQTPLTTRVVDVDVNGFTHLRRVQRRRSRSTSLGDGGGDRDPPRLRRRLHRGENQRRERPFRRRRLRGSRADERPKRQHAPRRRRDRPGRRRQPFRQPFRGGRRHVDWRRDVGDEPGEYLGESSSQRARVG